MQIRLIARRRNIVDVMLLRELRATFCIRGGIYYYTWPRYSFWRGKIAMCLENGNYFVIDDNRTIWCFQDGNDQVKRVLWLLETWSFVCTVLLICSSKCWFIGTINFSIFISTRWNYFPEDNEGLLERKMVLQFFFFSNYKSWKY